MPTPPPPEADELTIKTNGVVLGGWQEIHVVRGVERLPSAFYIRATEAFPGQTQRVSIVPGAKVEVNLSGDLVLTGYLDQYLPSADPENHYTLLKGRSLCEDLVDSSLYGPDVGGWTLQASTMKQAAEKIAKPFKIEVSMPDGDFPIPAPNVFPINPGVSAAQLLEEIARTAGALVWDDEKGRLVISAVGKTRAATALIEGQNLEFMSGALTMDQRFSDYYVLGQSYDLGTGAINQFAHATDPNVVALGRHRTKIIPWEAPDQDGAYSQKRAQWEASRRMGRGNMVICRVTGWRQGDGKLWTPNLLTHITSPTTKINADMVIAEVAWQRDERNGTSTQLTCMPAAGLAPQPLIIQPAVVGAGEAPPHG